MPSVRNNEEDCNGGFHRSHSWPITANEPVDVPGTPSRHVLDWYVHEPTSSVITQLSDPIAESQGFRCPVPSCSDNAPDSPKKDGPRSIFDRPDLRCLFPNVNASTGEILRCKRRTCPYCLLVDAGRTVGAIALSTPTHAFALTLVGNSAAEIQKSVTRWIRCLRKVTGLNIQIIWAAEPGPKGTNPHVHGFLWSTEHFDEAEIAEAVSRSGIGREFGFECCNGDYNASYLAYILKCLNDDELRDLFLKLNGSGGQIRYFHNSSDFFRNGADGEKLTHRQAIVEAYRRARERDGDLGGEDANSAGGNPSLDDPDDADPSDDHACGNSLLDADLFAPEPECPSDCLPEEGPLAIWEHDRIADLMCIGQSDDLSERLAA